MGREEAENTVIGEVDIIEGEELTLTKKKLYEKRDVLHPIGDEARTFRESAGSSVCQRLTMNDFGDAEIGRRHYV